MRRLGRRPHSPEAVAAAPALRYGAEAPPPPTLDRSDKSYQPQLLGNDSYPNCTVVALINAALAVEAIQTNGALAFDPQSWVPFYAVLAGCDPTPAAIGASDGLVLLDVLRRQAVQGFDIGAVAPLTGDFGTVPLDRMSLASCMTRLGVVYLGVDLAQSDLTSPAGTIWDADVPDPSLGHCVCLWDYSGLRNGDVVRLATWGGLQPCSWEWIAAHAREAYGLLFPAVEGPGVDVAALRAANQKWLLG